MLKLTYLSRTRGDTKISTDTEDQFLDGIDTKVKDQLYFWSKTMFRFLNTSSARTLRSFTAVVVLCALKQQHTATSLNQHATVVMAEQIKKNKKENLELQQKRRQEEGDASTSRPPKQRQSSLVESFHRGSSKEYPGIQE